MASTANYSLWDNHRYLQRYAVSSWVSILWWVKIRHLPLTWPVAVNTQLYSSDFDEILYTAPYFELDERHVIKIKISNIQDGGGPPFWKSIYRHISVKNHRIFMKFCTQQQLGERHVIKNEKVALDRLRVRQNVFSCMQENESET